MQRSDVSILHHKNTGKMEFVYKKNNNENNE